VTAPARVQKRVSGIRTPSVNTEALASKLKGVRGWLAPLPGSGVLPPLAVPKSKR